MNIWRRSTNSSDSLHLTEDNVVMMMAGGNGVSMVDSTPIHTHQHQQHHHRASLHWDKLSCLNPMKVANRRHSSEMKNILPKISISRAKSEIDLVINSVNDEQCVNGISLLHPNRRSDRSTLASTNLSMSTTIQSRSLQPISHLKEHKYQSVTKVLNLKSDKCRICSESIYFHCYECVQCKLMAHKKCLQNLYIKCPNKPMPPRLAVFGLNISNDNQISEVLSVCVREIENRPIHQLKSIYKMDGDRYTIKRICLSFEFGPHLIDLDNISVHDIAGVVKEYLIQLSTPIFSNEIQDELITIGKEWPVRKVPYTQSGLAILIFELRRLMSYLSPSYRKNLTFLIYHFKRIVDSQNITEINANALGMTFANIIFKVCQRKEEDYEETFESNFKKNEKHSPINNRKDSQFSIITNGYKNDARFEFNVPFKIRVLELMILHSMEIFS